MNIEDFNDTLTVKELQEVLERIDPDMEIVLKLRDEEFSQIDISECYDPIIKKMILQFEAYQ